MEENLDEIILKEIKHVFKTQRRIKEDLDASGIEASGLRIDARLRSFRKAGMVMFERIESCTRGPSPLAYKIKVKEND